MSSAEQEPSRMTILMLAEMAEEYALQNFELAVEAEQRGDAYVAAQHLEVALAHERGMRGYIERAQAMEVGT